ncbi:MAG TPA: carbohydrate porin [Gemmatimonadaceae bacterium]|nr:carbohydrate porin [Gemmatimonadaceae bacterium]
MDVPRIARRALGAVAALALAGPAARAGAQTAGDSICAKAEDPHRRPASCSTPAGGPVVRLERTLARDWGGARSWLAARGITPTLSLYAAPMTSNTTASGARGWSWVNQSDLGLAIDLRKGLGAQGLQLYIGMVSEQGPSLSGKIGNLFDVQGQSAGYGFWIGEVYLQQTLDGGRLTVAVGRLASNASFGALPVAVNYLSAAIQYGNPLSLYINDDAFTAPPPGVQWGAQAAYAFGDGWQLGGGIYNNNPNSSAGNDHGLEWQLQQGNSGAMIVAQIQRGVNQGAKATGLPGWYAVGGSYDANWFATLPDGASESKGIWQLWAMAQQMVLRGLTLWGAVTYTGRELIAEMPVDVSGGASWAGAFAARPADILSAGWYYGNISSHVPSATAETVVEVNYQFVVTGWLTVMPDVQRIWRPAGTTTPIAGATAAGAQVIVVF